MAVDPVCEAAAAKINLCLHVTGRRADGYHLLDSLVAFTTAGDRVTASPDTRLSLLVRGPEAAALVGADDNLVLRAARAMGVAARLELWKELPVASGIGGGSADAAAALRALVRLTGRNPPEPAEILALGADVPVCLAGRPARMRGIGEVLSPSPPLPPAWLVLVNPRLAVPTPAVFAALARRENPPLPEPPVRGWATVHALADWLRQETRNDLEESAVGIAPVIGSVQAAFGAVKSCLLARMSGSGATCFGLFASAAEATACASILRRRAPGWWVRETALQLGR